MTSINPVYNHEIKHTNFERRVINTANLSVAFIVNAIITTVVSNCCHEITKENCNSDIFPIRCNIHKILNVFPCAVNEYRYLMGGALPASFWFGAFVISFNSLNSTLKNYSFKLLHSEEISAK